MLRQPCAAAVLKYGEPGGNIVSIEVRIDNVVKKFGDFRAVDGVSISVKEGEFFTLLGPSGCGKTTLLRMIAGFNRIDQGEIYFGNKLINNIAPNKRDIGMVFQNYAVFPHMSVAENVAYGLKARKVPKAEREKRVMEALELVQIADLKDRRPDALSGGQQQRVALARAFVIEPSILLMDEPLSNLDAKLRVQMRGMIKKLQSKLGITTIYVTHDQEEALSISDRIAVMNAGHVMQIGKPDAIYRKPDNLFVANFIGNSNQLEGRISHCSEGGEAVIELKGECREDVKLRERYTGNVTAAIRPEHFIFAEKGRNTLHGKIETATFLGDFVQYEVELSDGQVIEVNEYGNMDDLREEGTEVDLAFKADHISIYKNSGEVISC